MSQLKEIPTYDGFASIYFYFLTAKVEDVTFRIHANEYDHPRAVVKLKNLWFRAFDK